jgi:hypothetical protein
VAAFVHWHGWLVFVNDRKLDQRIDHPACATEADGTGSLPGLRAGMKPIPGRDGRAKGEPARFHSGDHRGTGFPGAGNRARCE